MKKIALFVVVACVAGLFGLPLLIGIWLPDVFFPARHVLAEERLSNGDVFQLINYWNSGDFYNSEILYRPEGGSEKLIVLDPDDDKQWRGALQVDATNRLVTVQLGKERSRIIRWSEFDSDSREEAGNFQSGIPDRK